MKNEVTTLPNGAGGHTTYADLIVLILSSGGEKGIEREEMDRREPLIDKVEATKHGSSFAFTAEEITKIHELERVHRWPNRIKQVQELGHKIEREATMPREDLDAFVERNGSGADAALKSEPEAESSAKSAAKAAK